MEERIRAERRRRARRWMIALAAAGLLTTNGYAARAATTSTFTALVKLRPGSAGVHERLGGTVLRTIPAIGYDVVALPSAGALAAYAADAGVAVAEPNVSGSIALSPSDACHVRPCDGIPGQWHHLMTNTPFGWDLAPSRADITIAVLDTKIDAGHPDFVNADGTRQVLAGIDLVPASQQGGSALYHGTFVAGLAAAATGNGIDVAGVGFAASVLPITVVDGAGMTDAARLAEAIVLAHRRGARVINLSLGITAPSQAVLDAIRLASRDALVVAAAGNNTGSAPFYPGSYPEVLSVSGTDANDRPAACSNHNANVGVAAPADRLIGLQHMPGRLIQAPCGTSAAAPQVSGLAALLFAQDPARTPAQVRAIIERSADDLGEPGRDDRFGHGRINIARALDGRGPAVRSINATVVKATGGTSTVSAKVPAGTTAAQVIVGAPGATAHAMNVSGSRASLDVNVPALGKGPHPIWVRARDASGWGRTSVGILALDGTGPTIWAARADEGVRLAGQPLTITFAIGDDYATRFAHGIEAISSVTGTVVHRAVRYDTSGGPQTYRWLPALDVPSGHYRVKIGVADEVGNVSVTELGAIVA